MKLGIIGSIRYINWAQFKTILTKCKPKTSMLVNTGYTKGCDVLVRRFASEEGVNLLNVFPKYHDGKYNALEKACKEVIGISDRILIFDDGNSSSIRNIVAFAEQCGIKKMVVKF
tara:strand:- start:18281 stop:18625 length:345 start_codon:yes stop_codon:yes gene_type:complete